MKEQAMRCLYCGQQLKLLRRLTGGDFCSAEHRRLFEGHFSERALNRLLKEEPIEVSDSSPTEHGAEETAASPKPTAPANRHKDVPPDQETPGKPSATAPEQAQAQAPNASPDPGAEKNPEDRPGTPESESGKELTASGQSAEPEIPRNLASIRTMIPFIDDTEQDRETAEAGAVPPPDSPALDEILVDEVSASGEVLIPDEASMKGDEPVLAEPIADLPAESALSAPTHAEPPRTSGAALGVATATTLAVDVACQSGIDPQRFQLATAGLDRLTEQLTVANDQEPSILEEIPVAVSPDSEAEIERARVDAATEPAAEHVDTASEPEQNPDSEPSETEESDEDWLNREWQESTLLPVPLSDNFIQDWQPRAARCAEFPSRDPEFSVSQPEFEAPQPRELGKLPELVTEAASWQGDANPGRALEIHWHDTPLGKLSTECVAGTAVRLAFPAVGLDRRGKGPMPVRPIGPIGLPKKLTPPPDGPTETSSETTTQNPRNTLPPRTAARQQEAENDVDQVEARLQSLTALARFTQRPAAAPPESVLPIEEVRDQDAEQTADLVPPPAVNTPLPVTLLGSAAPRRRATVVFPIGIPAQLGPVISIPAKVPIREMIYLLAGNPEEERVAAAEASWLENTDLEEFQEEDMRSVWDDVEAEDPHDPFFDEFPEDVDLELPSALAEEPLEEIDEQAMQSEVYPQEGPENV